MPSGSERFDTIVLDSSILFTILLNESGYEQYEEIVNNARELVIGAPTLGEVGIVVHCREGRAGVAGLLLNR